VIEAEVVSFKTERARQKTALQTTKGEKIYDMVDKIDENGTRV
jgi:hypothetical protein